MPPTADYFPKNLGSRFRRGAELKKITGSIATELDSPLARLGLVSFADWFRSARIETKPLGYEGEKQFVEGSLEVLTALYGIVPTFESQLRSEPDSQLVSTLSEAFRRNASSIQVVFGNVRKYAEPLRSFSDEQFFRYQLMVASILYEKKKPYSN